MSSASCNVACWRWRFALHWLAIVRVCGGELEPRLVVESSSCADGGACLDEDVLDTESDSMRASLLQHRERISSVGAATELDQSLDDKSDAAGAGAKEQTREELLAAQQNVAEYSAQWKPIGGRLAYVAAREGSQIRKLQTSWANCAKECLDKSDCGSFAYCMNSWCFLKTKAITNQTALKRSFLCSTYIRPSDGKTPPDASCKSLGCTTSYQPEHPCQCNRVCERYNNCCLDIYAACHNLPPKNQGPDIRDRSWMGTIKGIAYGPSPETTKGVRIPNDDFMSLQAAPLWADWGRGDIALVKKMGANTMRLYGNDPSQNHGPFLDTAHKHGIGVVTGISDWPYIQMPGSCKETGYNCFDQVYESYTQNLKNGFLVRNSDGEPAYHPALRVLSIINEPEMGKLPQKGTAQCKAPLSALDAILQAEKDYNVSSKRSIAFTVTYSIAIVYGQKPAVGQMQHLYECMRNPFSSHSRYTPKNDLWLAYRTRFVNSFNTFWEYSKIMKLYGEAKFWRSEKIPLFVAEFNILDEVEGDVAHEAVRDAVQRRYPFFLGVNWFEFQTRYDKGDDEGWGSAKERRFGMYALDRECDMGLMKYFGQNYTVHPLLEKGGEQFVSTAMAVAQVYGGTYFPELTCRQFEANCTSCLEEALWASTEGINAHPGWYPGLNVSSPFRDFQTFIAGGDPSKCPGPCLM